MRRRSREPLPERFPFTVPVVGALEEFRFTEPVTILVGENGSGKSTLLEGLAAVADAAAMGSAEIAADPTLAAARAFAAHFTLARKGARPAATLFLRAEDVFGFSQRVTREMATLSAQVEAYEDELRDADPRRHHGIRFAMGAIAGQRASLARRYGEDPDARSHGETFLHFLRERLVPRGLYFLDEPETPLSPTRVLALLAMIADGVAEGSQFVIATHSPILMALPRAAIYEVAGAELRGIGYDEVEHVRITRDFLAAPQRYLRRLAEAEPAADGEA